MSKTTIKNLPKKIYLQVGMAATNDFKDVALSEVSWSKHRIFDTDICYKLDLTE